MRVPDVEFYINVGDWPLETRRSNAVPVLSWCGSTDTQDIVLPTYEVTHSTLETMRGVTNDLLSVQGNTGITHTQTHTLSLLRHCVTQCSSNIKFRKNLSLDFTVYQSV